MSEGMGNPFLGRLTRIQVTSPDIEIRHNISDEELDLLCESKAGNSKDICLLCAGALFGSVVPAAEQLSRFNDKVNPMGLVGLISCFILASTLAGSLVTGVIWRTQVNKNTPLKERIRGRPKFEVI